MKQIKYSVLGGKRKIAFFTKKEQKQIREIWDYVMRITLEAQSKYNTHVFVSWSPHVGVIRLDAHVNGWDSLATVRIYHDIGIHDYSVEEFYLDVNKEKTKLDDFLLKIAKKYKDRNLNIITWGGFDE